MIQAIKDFLSIMFSSSHFFIGFAFGFFFGTVLPIIDIVSVHFLFKNKKGFKYEKGD